MRILQVNIVGADPSSGGTEKHLHRFGRLLPRRGHEVWYLSAYAFGRASPGPELVLHGTRERRGSVLLNRARDVAVPDSPRLKRILREAAPDVVHTHNLPGITTAIWREAGRLGIPVVHTAHDYYLYCPRSSLLRDDGTPCRPSEMLCALRSHRLLRHAVHVAALVTNTRYLMAVHHKDFPRASQVIIPNPMEWGSNLTDIPHSAAFRTLGYIGRLSGAKGVDVLLGAVPDLEALGISLEIAGDGPLRTLVERAAQERPGTVRFWGRVAGNEKVRFFASCDVGVMPSVYPEPGGPPNAMLEWLQAGRPVLSSARGGLVEAIGRPGVIEIDPSRIGISQGVRRLCKGASWTLECRNIVRRSGSDEETAWIDAYSSVFEEVAAK